MAPIRARLALGREHFQHGPIDLIVEAFGVNDAVGDAYERAWRRFDGLLEELVAELPLLRGPVQQADGVRGTVALRMVRACSPYRDVFITPMAAVAGAVADEVVLAMTAAGDVRKAYVNNGGDIALYLAEGEQFRVGLLADVSRPLRHGHAVALDGAFEVTAAMAVGGVATSGWRGRSWSLGIADSVTVLAGDAAGADAAATMVANAVIIDHPAVSRRPACEVDDNTDLGDLPVTVDVGRLPASAVRVALDRGEARARELVARGLIWGAVLVLQSHYRTVGRACAALQPA